MQLSCQHFALEDPFAPNGACFGCLNGKEHGRVPTINAPSAKGHVHFMFWWAVGALKVRLHAQFCFQALCMHCLLA